MQAPGQEHDHLVAAINGEGTESHKRRIETTDVISVTPTDSAQVALSRLLQTNADALPVVDNETVVGIISQSQIQSSINEDSNTGDVSHQQKSSIPERNE